VIKIPYLQSGGTFWKSLDQGADCCEVFNSFIQSVQSDAGGLVLWDRPCCILMYDFSLVLCTKSTSEKGPWNKPKTIISLV